MKNIIDIYNENAAIAATPCNTIGMGNPCPATDTQVGSEPLTACAKKQCKGKKKAKKVVEASILADIEDTIEYGNIISQTDKLISKLFSSPSEDDFNDTLYKLIKSIKSVYKKVDEKYLKEYYSGDYDKSQIFIVFYKDQFARPEHKNELKYCDAHKSGVIRWIEENYKKFSIKNHRYFIELKNNITKYSRIFDIYMVPVHDKSLWENIMKKRKY